MKHVKYIECSAAKFFVGHFGRASPWTEGRGHSRVCMQRRIGSQLAEQNTALVREFLKLHHDCETEMPQRLEELAPSCDHLYLEITIRDSSLAKRIWGWFMRFDSET